MTGVDVQFRFGEILDLAARLPKVQPAVEAKADSIGELLAHEGVRRTQQRVRKDEGTGARSITARRTARTWTFGTPLSYMRVMEKGRRAGARMPPSGVMLPWMRRHGIPASHEFVIRRAIGRRGIKGDHVFADVRKELAPQAKRELGALKQTVLATLEGRGR